MAGDRAESCSFCGKPAAQATEPSEGAPSDQPQTGVKYRVKSGDTVTKIALRHGSKVEWILKANNLSSPAALKADVDIFVPQPENAGR
jgi:LysM repeat protein